MTEIYRSKIADAGRVVIPAELRRAMGLDEGQEVVFVKGEQGVELLTSEQALQRVQATVREYIPDDSLDLTNELLEARTTDGSFS